MSTSNSVKRRTGNDDDNADALTNIAKRRRKDHDEDTQGRNQTRFSHNDYNVGWVCALHTELAAARAMLDEEHSSLPKSANDSNTYILGRISQHNIVIAWLPIDGYGTNNAAIVAGNMNRSFPCIGVRLMVGIGGGAPKQADIRLGDVVVSNRVVQYDSGKTVRNGQFQRTFSSQRPPQAVMIAVAKLRADHESRPSAVPTIISQMLERNPHMFKYSHPGPNLDELFDGNYDHIQMMHSCDHCDKSKLLQRLSRGDTNPRIHYGGIASANQVMKHGKTRDELAKELDILCFEMEAAGLMNEHPFLIIRGICDYSDTHKNKQWQEYAAATAAAYAKELLYVVEKNETQQTITDPVPPTANPPSLQDCRKALMESLGFEQMEARRDNIKSPHSKTCEWLLQHPAYIDWLDPDKLAQHQGLLWISGKPGAGKSTLMKYAYTDASKRVAKEDVCISFFFNARGDALEKTTMGMYRYMLLRLLEKLPDLQEVLDLSELFPGGRIAPPKWTIRLLRRLFSAAIARLGQRRITCFIDALDECNEEQVQDMVTYFEDLGQTAIENRIKLYICFSSRHYPSIDIQNGRRLVLEDQVGHGEDMAKYVRRHLSAKKGKYVEEIRDKILEKANGVFLWVALVIPILNQEFRRGRIFAVKKKLGEVPDGLTNLFKNILTRDNTNMADLLLCIQWILFAKRPLRREEFYFALVSGLDPDPENLEYDPDHITTDDIDRFVLNSSKGLAELTRSKSRTVQFIHESVRDFLIKDDGLRELWPELGDDFQSLSHDRLKECCYAYLKVDTSGQVPELPKASSDLAKDMRQKVSSKFPFLEYATRYVLYHANAAAAGLSQSEFLEEFALTEWINHDNLFQIYGTRRHTLSASLLYILAEYNFARLISTRCQQNSTTSIKGERYRYPLFAALANGHRDAVKAILQLEAGPPDDNDIMQLDFGQGFTAPKEQTPWLWAAENGHAIVLRRLLEQDSGIDIESIDVEKGGTALSWAAQKGHQNAVRLLLESGANTEAKSFLDRRTPLIWAVLEGHESVTRLLLENGADIEAKDTGYYRTPLLWATEGSHEDFVPLLLNNGANIEARNSLDQTPLSRAAQKGHENAVRLVLENGANIEAKSIWHSRTPLIWAVLEGRENVTRLLLENGADIEVKDTYGRTPLIWAAKGGHEDVVRLLLENGADIEAKSIWDDDRAPLTWAALEGHASVTRLLLENGADIEVKDTHGQTPLMWATGAGHENVVKLLLENGAEAEAKENKGD